MTTTLLLDRVRRGRVTRARSAFEGYKPLRVTGPFLGFNSYQSPDTIPQGLGKSGLLHSPDCLNMYSYPFGSMTSFFGHANINSIAANASKAITGIAYMGEIAQNILVAVRDKIGEDVGGTWTDRTGAASITDSADNPMDAAILTSLAVLTFRSADAPLKWSGSGDVATLGGSPRAGVKYVVAFDRRCWLFSAQNGDYSAKDNAESYDTTDDTLNFSTADGSIITSATRVGDAIYVGKDGANAGEGHLFRVYRTGNEALPYAFEEIETGGVGPISQQATKALPNGDLIFFAKDGNVYVMRGNVVVPVGRNIQRTILADYNKSRFQYAAMGVLRERGLVGLSLSLSGSTTNNRAWWYDYLNSTPSRPELEIWHPTDHAINAFGERVSSGQIQLVSGGYDGFYERQLSGDSYAGSAYTKRYKTPWLLLGDYFTTYHILGIVAAFEPTGNFNVTLKYQKDFSQSQTTAGTFNVLGGAALGSFVLGTDVLGGDEQGLAYLTLNTAARRLQLEVSNNVVSQKFNIHALYLLVKPLYQSVNV